MAGGNIKWEKRTSAREACAHLSSRIKDRVILITGPSLHGIGFETALSIALQKPKLLILAGRSMSKLEDSKAEIEKQAPDTPLRLLKLDLASMAQVREAAKEVNDYEENIDVLINNAATMDNPYTLTPEGNEIQFAINYLGHWLFTMSILPKILKSKGKRIVNVSSGGHVNGDIRWDDPAFKHGEYNKKAAYGQSKTALNLWTLELARRYGGEGLVAFSLNPGGISTPLQKHWDEKDKSMVYNGKPIYEPDGSVDSSDTGVWKTLDQGASTSVRAAFDITLDSHNGEYLDDCQPAADKVKPWAKDPVSPTSRITQRRADEQEAAKRLWDWTNQHLGERF